MKAMMASQLNPMTDSSPTANTAKVSKFSIPIARSLTKEECPCRKVKKEAPPVCSQKR